MKRLLIIALSLVGMATTSAKDKIEATIGADLVSQYIWRGQNLGDFSLQPTLGVGYKGISLSAWGSVGISNSSNTKELDLTLKYEHKGFSVGVTDYWFSEGSYFQYHAHKTTHVWEGFVGYDFGFLSATWYTNFAGNDGLNGTVGIVPWRTTSYGTNDFACTNVSLRATKNFLIKQKYHLPVYAGLTSNPCSGKFYFIFGIAFSLNTGEL